MKDNYFDCPTCRKAFQLADTDPRVCPHCGHSFSPFPKGSTAGLVDVPEELEETLGEELRDTFAKLLPKMVRGKMDYGNESLGRSLSELLEEIDEELLDVFGWGVIARRKVSVLRGVIKVLEQHVEDLRNKAHPIHVVPLGTTVPVVLQDMPPGQIIEYEPQVTWLPIESAPKDGTTVLVWSPGCSRAISHWCDNLEGAGCWMNYGTRTPTHWHPLPESPAGSVDQGSEGS